MSKKVIGLVLVAILAMSMLVACGGTVDASDPNQGLWTATVGEAMGVEVDAAEVFKDGFTIELQSDGKCRVSADGSSSNAKWTLDGNAITITVEGETMSGTLENGLLTLENVFESGVNFKFEKK